MGKSKKKTIGKYGKKKDKRSRRGLLIAIGLIGLIALALLTVPQMLYRLGDEVDGTGEDMASPPETESAETGDPVGEEATLPPGFETMEFPVLLESEKLRLDSVFLFDGINPDCDNREGKNIAAITVSNLSDTYLERGEFSVTADTGKVLRFVVEELPAGKTAIALSVDHASVKQETGYGDVRCEAIFNPQASMLEEQVSVTVEGNHVTVSNNTDADIGKLTLYCHSTLGDQYFGGTAYCYEIDHIPVSGTAEFIAEECFLGLAEAVRILYE